MLDCNTTEGKKFIKKENETRNILQNFYKDKLLTIKKPTDKAHTDDGMMYMNSKLHGVCEIKTRPHWNRKRREPFTLERFLNDRKGYLITEWKLTGLQKVSKENLIWSYIFLNIPYEKRIVKFRVTDRDGNFFIKYNSDFTETYYSSNDYKGKVFRDNAYIPYKGNEEHIEWFNYG